MEVQIRSDGFYFKEKLFHFTGKVNLAYQKSDFYSRENDFQRKEIVSTEREVGFHSKVKWLPLKRVFI